MFLSCRTSVGREYSSGSSSGSGRDCYIRCEKVEIRHCRNKYCVGSVIRSPKEFSSIAVTKLTTRLKHVVARLTSKSIPALPFHTGLTVTAGSNTKVSIHTGPMESCSQLAAIFPRHHTLHPPYHLVPSRTISYQPLIFSPSSANLLIPFLRQSTRQSRPNQLIFS